MRRFASPHLEEGGKKVILAINWGQSNDVNGLIQCLIKFWSVCLAAHQTVFRVTYSTILQEKENSRESNHTAYQANIQT